MRALQYSFTLYGEKGHCESKASCPKTQQYEVEKLRTQTSRPRVYRTNLMASSFTDGILMPRTAKLPLRKTILKLVPLQVFFERQ